MSETISFAIDNKQFQCELDTNLPALFTVKSSPKPYTVRWDDGEPLAEVNKLLSDNPRNVLMIDKNVLELYGKDLTVDSDRMFVAEASEQFKTLDGALQLLDFIYQRKLTKGEKLIVVGGGIIQDVSALVAAIYKRGIPSVHFPTTLLAMCDSCIGGKAGINYKDAKNQIALFSSPTEVIINTAFLNTLPEEALKSGMGEILKLFIIGGEPFLTLYESLVNQGAVRLSEDYPKLIANALNIKRAVIEEDEFEFNHRRSLNYGHTLGHAIEVLSDYEIMHGQAVAVGMVLVNELSHIQQLLDKDHLLRLNRLCLDLLSKNILNIVKNLPLDQMTELLQKDKKTVGSIVNFVMVSRPGVTNFVGLNLNSELLNAIKQIIQTVILA